MKHLRPLIMFAAISSFLLAIATPVVFSVTVAFSRTAVQSKYREIDIRAIDQERIKQVHEGRFADDWTAVVNWLNEGYEDWRAMGWVIGILWAANGFFLIFLWSQYSPERQPECGSPVPVHQQPDKPSPTSATQ